MKYSKNKIKKVIKSKKDFDETLKKYKGIIITVTVIVMMIITLTALVLGTMHIIRDSIYITIESS
ncbi:hypothetical protein BJH92_02630 [Paenibacillus polymyxa]|nr:hypothetical protein C1A50_4318 [Paenibacillus polymyxa]RFT98418.1 hypothetical protein DX902_08965 [Paenibacillus jamilae]KAE8561704.1 hypothetical protein BJH92_02630 [Paenibacillus polymyxa]KJK29643.1 hypothetical protein TY89_17485 [Paenibacillus polymyxa]PTU45537.1 hypothetical protein DBL67_18125 [Paenibacillus polymyxa]